MAFMFMIAVLCTSIGTAVASVLEDIQGFQLIINFLVMPLFFFSNALFPVAGLPGILKLVVRLNPLSYGIDGIRGALTHGFLFIRIGPGFSGPGTRHQRLLVGLGSYLFSQIQNCKISYRFRMTCVAASPGMVWTGLKPSFGKSMPENRFFPFADNDRRDGQMNFVDLGRHQVLTNRRNAAAGYARLYPGPPL